MLAQEHKKIHEQNKIKAKAKEVFNPEKNSKNKPAVDYKINYMGYLDSNKSKEKEDNNATPIKRKQINNFFEGKGKISKLKVEIDLPLKEENQLKYSITTTSSDGQRIIYLKQKKKSSKDDNIDPEEVLNKFVEEGDIVLKPKSVKKAPIKNAKAFLTSNFPNELKSESHKETKIDGDKLSIFQRLSSAKSNTNEKISETSAIKSLSKESQNK